MYEEFVQFMESVIKEGDELRGAIAFCKDKEEYMRDITEFIKENNLSCLHLWEDSKDGDSSYEDWEKIIMKILLLRNKN